MRSIMGGATRAAPPQMQPRLDLQAAAGCFSLSLIVIVQATLVVLTEEGEGEFQEWWYYCAEVEVLQSALPPHIIVIIFIHLENRHVLFCVTILTRVTTHVNVFK